MKQTLTENTNKGLTAAPYAGKSDWDDLCYYFTVTLPAIFRAVFP